MGESESSTRSSYLVECCYVDRLDKVFKLGNLFLQEVGTDLNISTDITNFIQIGQYFAKL